ncbi:hypothetical protein AC623_20710, partial [Bacillus sp. FJAT-27231]|uniref:hypothetical protein n=1 Tax=Bacillus sp. FJAT-27231 TaxID=1679168 RepID=UPI000670B0C8
FHPKKAKIFTLKKLCEKQGSGSIFQNAALKNLHPFHLAFRIFWRCGPFAKLTTPKTRNIGDELALKMVPPKTASVADQCKVLLLNVVTLFVGCSPHTTSQLPPQNKEVNSLKYF